MHLRLFILFGLLTFGLLFQADFACAKTLEIESQATTEEASVSIARLKALRQCIHDLIPIDIAKKHAGVIRTSILQKAKDLTELTALKKQVIDNHHHLLARVDVNEAEVEARLAKIPEIKEILDKKAKSQQVAVTETPPLPTTPSVQNTPAAKPDVSGEAQGKPEPKVSEQAKPEINVPEKPESKVKPTKEPKPVAKPVDKPKGPTDDEFLTLLAVGDPKAILAAIKAKANVNAHVKSGKSKDHPALMVYLTSPKNGPKADLDVVRAMLAAGAKADWVSADKKLSLMRVAIAKHDPELLKLLLQTKPNLTWTGPKTGYNLLHSWLALNQNDPEILQAFLKAGFNPNAKRADHTYRTPAVFECIQTQGVFGTRPAEFLKLMLAAGADPNITDAKKDTALIYAVKANAEEHMQLLLRQKASLKALNDKDESALLVACDNYGTKIEIIKALLAGGADPNLASAKRHGLTPLVAAVRCGRKDVVEALLKAGAKIDAALPDKSTALICAVEANDEGMVKFLLDAGANPNVVNQASYTPLVYALAKENLTLIKLLLAKGADQNVEISDLNEKVTFKAMVEKYGSNEIRSALLGASN